MLASLFNVTLRALILRAGPQDFPFDPRLTAPLALFAGAANAAMFAQVLPLGSAVAMAAALVAGLALITRTLLRMRKLEARAQQTLAALLATNALLTLALVPLFMQVAPVFKLIAENPALLEQPDAVKMPQGIAFVMNVLNLWSFVVTASIFRHAANVSLGIGFLLAFVSALSLLMFVGVAGSIAGVIFGGA